MFDLHNLDRIRAAVTNAQILPIAIVVINLIFNVVSNVCFKYSAASPAWQTFLGWQVAGNLAGLLTVLTLTWLLRFIPLHVAFPLTTGLAIIGVQLAAARLFFGETLSPGKWLGTLLIIAGIALLSGK